MKKSSRKTAAALLAAGMALSVILTGCGGGDSEETTAATTTAAAGSSAPAATTAAAGNSAAAETTAAGNAETEAAESGHEHWVSDETVTISFMTNEGASQTIPAESASREALLEKTNVKLDIQTAPSASYAEKMNISLGTNNFADIIYLEGGSTVMAQYAEDGIFEPLMQYVNEETMPNFYKFWVENPEMKKYLIDGELYAFPVIGRNETANGFGAVIRTDLLEKNNIPLPTTFEELLDALTKLKEIYPDSTPWIGRKGTLQLLATTSYMLGSGFGDRSNPMYWDADRGAYIFGPADENFKAVLDYLHRAYAAGVLDPEFATQTQETMEAKLESGRSFFYLDNSGFGQNYTAILQQVEGQEDGKLQVLPTLENSFGQRRAVAYATLYQGRFYAINAGCEHMDELIQFIDYLYSEEGSNITNYGKEGYSFELDENGEPQFIQSYLEQFKGAQPSSYYAVYSDLGITKLDLSLWACNTETQFKIQRALGEFTPLVEEYWDIIANDDSYVEPHITPSFTIEESEQITDLLTDITTYLETQYNDFIMGVKDISEWDAVIAEQESRGVRTLEEIYNNAEARANAQ